MTDSPSSSVSVGCTSYDADACRPNEHVGLYVTVAHSGTYTLPSKPFVGVIAWNPSDAGLVAGRVVHREVDAETGAAGERDVAERLATADASLDARVEHRIGVGQVARRHRLVLRTGELMERAGRRAVQERGGQPEREVRRRSNHIPNVPPWSVNGACVYCVVVSTNVVELVFAPSDVW